MRTESTESQKILKRFLENTWPNSGPPIVNECPACGSDRISSDANFCTECAFDLRPLQTTLPCCQKKILLNHEAKYCPFCGTGLNLF